MQSQLSYLSVVLTDSEETSDAKVGQRFLSDGDENYVTSDAQMGQRFRVMAMKIMRIMFK